MKSLLAKMPWLPWVVGTLVLGALLVVFRASLHLPLLLVLVIVVILLLVIAITFLIGQLRKAQAAEAIEQTITTQADRDIERSTPGELAELQGLKSELLAAIESLKKAGGKGEDVLARLPWYMIIGPSGAGKSELVRRSGLHFPLQDAASKHPRAVRGIGGSRNFSWWLAEEAVLLDMTGRALATAAFDDSGDWLAFLQTLRKQRPERPVNGVLVVVAVDQIADQPEGRVDSLARAARERIHELTQHLGIVFPVYLVFNRCDQVAGFAEFFAELGTEERREPWGATFALDRARANPADQIFDEEVGVLLGALSERRLSRMADAADAAARARAFAFPLQLERVRPNLRRFVRTLFDGAEAAESPLFRGFYFASAAQQGEPVDRVLEPSVRAIGLGMRAPAVSPTAGGAWFVRDLFTDVVFPDAALAATSQHAMGALKRRELVSLASFGGAALLLAALFSGFSCSNMGLVGRARRAAIAAAEQASPRAIAMDNLRALEPLRASMEKLDTLETRGVPLWRRLGAWQGRLVRDPALDLYARRLGETIVAPSVRALELDVRGMNATNSGTFLEHFEAFRAWRLLAEPKTLVAEDAELIADEMRRVLARNLALASPGDREAFRAMVDAHARSVAAHPEAFAAVARDLWSPPDPTLVQVAAARVRDTWDGAAFHARLLERAGRGLAAASFATLGGKGSLVTAGATVPGVFTKSGWQQRVKPRIEAYRRMMKRDLVIADAFGGNPPDLAGELTRLWTGDAVAAWKSFLDGLGMAAPPNLGAAADQLGQAAKGDSPLLTMLRAVRDETQLGEAAGTPAAELSAEFALLKDFFEVPGKGIQKAGNFAAEFVSKFPGFKKKKASTKGQTISALWQDYLGDAQSALNEAGAPGAPPEQLRVLMGAGDDKGNALQAVAQFADNWAATYSGTGPALSVARVLKMPISGAQGTAGSGLSSQFASAWQEAVVTPFRQNLAGKYPFASGGPDASLGDFAAAFGPQGYVWQFYEAQLKPFLNEDGSPKGDAKGVPASIAGFIKRAYEIRQAFFVAGDQPSLRFSVRTEPPRVDPPGSLTVRRVSLDCGGEFASYTMGQAQWQTLVWPGADPNAGASLRVNAEAADDGRKKKRKKNEEPPAVAVEGRTGEGIWGLFRLLDQASLSDQGGEASATWTLRANDSRLVVQYDLQGSTAKHPFREGFLRIAP